MPNPTGVVCRPPFGLGLSRPLLSGEDGDDLLPAPGLLIGLVLLLRYLAELVVPLLVLLPPPPPPPPLGRGLRLLLRLRLRLWLQLWFRLWFRRDGLHGMCGLFGLTLLLSLLPPPPPLLLPLLLWWRLLPLPFGGVRRRFLLGLALAPTTLPSSPLLLVCWPPLFLA